MTSFEEQSRIVTPLTTPQEADNANPLGGGTVGPGVPLPTMTSVEVEPSDSPSEEVSCPSNGCSVPTEVNSSSRDFRPTDAPGHSVGAVVSRDNLGQICNAADCLACNSPHTYMTCPFVGCRQHSRLITERTLVLGVGANRGPLRGQSNGTALARLTTHMTDAHPPGDLRYLQDGIDLQGLFGLGVCPTCETLRRLNRNGGFRGGGRHQNCTSGNDGAPFGSRAIPVSPGGPPPLPRSRSFSAGEGLRPTVSLPHLNRGLSQDGQVRNSIPFVNNQGGLHPVTSNHTVPQSPAGTRPAPSIPGEAQTRVNLCQSDLLSGLEDRGSNPNDEVEAPLHAYMPPALLGDRE
jgi:hypothetical protein